jgi:hypothetical protein
MASRVPPPANESSSSYLPLILRSNGPYGYYVRKVDSIYESVKEFLKHNLAWLKEAGGVKTLMIKFPDAIVSISKRIGPATHIPGKMINSAAGILLPIHKLGGCASSLLGFAEVGAKFPAMFNPSETQAKYVVKDADGNAYRAQFPLNQWEQRSNRALNIADWTLSFSGCAGFLWRLNHSADEKFPLASLATWSGRYMSLKGLYSESRFLYETLWVGIHLKYSDEQKKYIPVQYYDDVQKKVILVKNPTLAKEELAGSLFRLSLSVVCLSVDIFKALAPKDNNSKWLDTAIFCAGIAPTFITPLAMRYWPKMVVEPLYAAATA